MDKETLEQILTLAEEKGRLHEKLNHIHQLYIDTKTILAVYEMDYGIERIEIQESGGYEKAINRLCQQLEYLINTGIRKEVIFKDIARELRERNREAQP